MAITATGGARTATDPVSLQSSTGGNDPLTARIISQLGSMVSGGSQTANVPLWRTRPSQRRVSKRGPHTVAENASQITPSDFTTAEAAVSSWLDMSQADRDKFALYAVRYGLVAPQDQGDPSALANAWERMVKQASDYNSSRDVSRWISPWEATHRFAGQRLAGSSGAIDLYKPQVNREVTKKQFTRDEIQPTLDEIFQREMGRTPTKREVGIYLKAIQSAYNRHPETVVQNIQPGPSGTNITKTVSGGIDVNAQLANQVRGTSESDAYQAGVTYMQALEQAVRSPV